MRMGVFEYFVEMIKTLPAQAIPNALDLECRMLEDDLKHHRLVSPEDASSILCFGQFVDRAKKGSAMQRAKPLPQDHVVFYKETILRLIQAEKLPPAVINEFDYTFVTIHQS